MPEEFTPGERIRVVHCTDEHDPLPAGATGTVRNWNPAPWLRQLAVDYDPPHNHRRLMLTLTDGADTVAKLQPTRHGLTADGHRPTPTRCNR
ncbi:hypothetical protein [Streptomyces sp. CAU 1734]|uniref:hypothetical protein n=1 Tax=Streptomyces sp. CAU 1734 TaxID=3140360 RepID=UPI0032612315